MKRPQNNERESPLKEIPLRLPGQGVDELIREKETDAVFYILVTTSVLSLALVAWYHKLVGRPPQPWPYTIIAASFIAFSAVKLWRIKSQLRQLKQGRDGERIVAE